MILLEILLLIVFVALDGFLFYIFFESILPPLFILIGLFGAKNKIRAGYYIFLYTLFGSLFLLLALLKLQGFIGIISFDLIFKVIIGNPSLIVLFCGIFIAFAVKTPTIYLNN